MIVVVGSPIGRIADGLVLAAGMAARVALAAAAAGRSVQLVGKTGDDPTADAVVLDLARGGVGHVALLRDPARATPLEPPPVDGSVDADAVGPNDPADDPILTDPRSGRVVGDGPLLDGADVDLGLRYLTEFAVVVLAEPADPDTLAIVADAARWGEARMVVVVGAGEGTPDGLPEDVVVFEAPGADPDGVFATLVGNFAAALDEGVEPGEAFRVSIASDGWTGAQPD
ncbi:MAG TPA: hypothetical protein VGO15_08680 [Candidatus Limnocylindrales bacterium]|nr:hypothetical protein [Candidatus Limnocylindrales bacterium]